MNRPQSCGIAHGLLPQSGRWTRCSEVGTCVRSKEVLVAGAGPAGLKAAEIAARRGHRVTVYEEAQDLGGRLPHLRGTSARARFESVTWLVGELAHLGVEIHSNARLTADDISRIAPDTVVVATGAIPPPGPVGLELQGPRYISIDDALYFGAIKSVVVFDQNGTNEPAFVAEELAGRKHRMTFVTPFEVMAPYAGYTHRQDLIEACHDRFVSVFAGTSAKDCSDGSVAIVDQYGELRARVAAD